MFNPPLVFPFSPEWHSKQDSTSRGRMRVSKNSRCLGVMSSTSAQNAELADQRSTRTTKHEAQFGVRLRINPNDSEAALSGPVRGTGSGMFMTQYPLAIDRNKSSKKTWLSGFSDSSGEKSLKRRHLPLTGPRRLQSPFTVAGPTPVRKTPTKTFLQRGSVSAVAETTVSWHSKTSQCAYPSSISNSNTVHSSRRS